MSDPEISGEAELALREGLRALPAPQVSAGFDAGVLAALESPRRWWKPAWHTLRPALCGGIFSLCATVVMLRWCCNAASPGAFNIDRAAVTATANPRDSSGDRTDLSSATLLGIRSAHITDGAAGGGRPAASRTPRRPALMRRTLPAPPPVA